MKMRGIDWGHFMMGWFTALLLFLGPELVGQIIHGNVPVIILDSVVIVIDILCMLFWHQYCARKRAERKLDEILNEAVFDALQKELLKRTRHHKEKAVK